MKFKWALSFILLVVVINTSSAENTGTLNITTLSNYSIVTGLYGSTHSTYCSSNVSCVPSDFCAVDFDGKSVTGYTGWCINQVKCAHKYDSDSDQTPTLYTTTNSVCYGSELKTCTVNGTWASSSCSSGYICIDTACVLNSTTSSSSSSSSTLSSNATTTTSSFRIITKPSNFNITQSQNVTKSVIIFNNGTATIYNLTILLSGIDWYTNITKIKYPSLATNESVGFDIRFIAPANQTIGNYPVSINITTSSTALRGSIEFNITVLPSNKTVEEIIMPDIYNFTSELDELSTQIDLLKSKGVETTALENVMRIASQKITSAREYLADGDYYNTNRMIAESRNIINQLKTEVSKSVPPEQIDYFPWFIAGIVIVIIAAFILYIILPTKEHDVYYESENWKSSKKTGFFEKIKNLFRRKEKEQQSKETKEKFFFNFKKRS